MMATESTPARRPTRAPSATAGKKEASDAKPGRADQRARLLEAIVEVVAQDGYSQTKICDLARRADISRVTFYELFTNKEDCFLAAYREQVDRMHDQIARALAQTEPARAAQAALAALVEFADREPLAFNFLTNQAVLAGARALKERDSLMNRLQLSIERRWARAPADAPVLDMSAKLLLEGTTRLLGLKMCRERRISEGLVSDLLAWIDSYTAPPGPPRWRELVPDPLLLRTRAESSKAAPPHRPLPTGRRRLENEVARSIQHERIAYATAEATRARGHADITVADIVATAGLSRDAFYAHFQDKEEAFDRTFKLVFEQLLASIGGAFFACSGEWPDKIWEAGEALARSLESDRTLAHFLPIGTHGPTAKLDHVNDLVLTFTLFLEDGYNYRRESAQVPRLVSNALICVILEAVTFHIHHDRIDDARGLIPILVYLVLAPFMGTSDANEFVEAKTEAARDAAANRLGALLRPAT